MYIVNKSFLETVIKNIFTIPMILVHLFIFSCMCWLKSRLESKTVPNNYVKVQIVFYCYQKSKADGKHYYLVQFQNMTHLSYWRKDIRHQQIFYIARSLLLVNHLHVLEIITASKHILVKLLLKCFFIKMFVNLKLLVAVDLLIVTE